MTGTKKIPATRDKTLFTCRSSILVRQRRDAFVGAELCRRTGLSSPTTAATVGRQVGRSVPSLNPRADPF